MSDTLDYAMTIAGDVPESKAALLEAVCAAAEGELRARLRDGVTESDVGDAFNAAAGMLAISMYMLSGETDELSSFKAGTVSVSKRGSGAVRSSAAALRKQAETMLAQYLNDSGFAFMGVRS